MRLVCLLLVIMAWPSWASYDQGRDCFYGDKLDYRCLIGGTGLIGPPYEQAFLYQVVLGDGFLHFILNHPLDPGQIMEIDEYQSANHLGWRVGWFEVNNVNWTAVAVPADKDPQIQCLNFLDQLRHMSFVKYLH